VALFAVFAMRFTQTHLPTYQGPKHLLPGVLIYAVVATGFFLSARDYAQANAGFALLAAIGVGLTIWSVLRLLHLAFAKPTPPLVAVAGGAMIYLLLLLNDYAIGANRTSLGEIFMRQYAALPLFIAITGTLAKRYRDALTQTRELAASLQSQVAVQREQLERSFERLREAEREQAREQERARVMGDLHDGLGLHLATALRQARTEGTSRDVLLSSLQDCLDELRVAIDSLDEQERDPLSLLGSLRFRMAPRFAALGMRLDWEIDPDLSELPLLDPSQALHLLRLAQEMLSNAIKHSQATVVTLALSAQGDGVLIRITDNGKGFNPDTATQGRGLGHLHTRAQRLGATIHWERPATQGFSWVLRLQVGKAVGTAG
jgi:signal transduction histidine kinase